MARATVADYAVEEHLGMPLLAALQDIRIIVDPLHFFPAHWDPILSRNGASGNPGAVQICYMTSSVE